MRLLRAAVAVLNNRRGAVSVIGMLLLPCFIGMAGLVVETGHALVEKVENQRVADQAAIAGAIAYNSTNSEASMRSAAGAVATLNGYQASQVDVRLVGSPNNAPGVPTSNPAYINAVQATITTSVPLVFSRLLGAGSNLSVPSAAMVELKKQQETCLLALDGSAAGIPLTGGTQVNAPACSIATNASASVPCGTSMTSIGLTYDGAAPTRCASPESIKLPSGAALAAIKQHTNDPLATNADIIAARSRMTQVAALVSPVAPPAPPAPVVPQALGVFKDMDFTKDDATVTSSATAIGCVATKDNGNWTLTCPAGGTYRFNTLVGQVRFNPLGSSSSVYLFRNNGNAAFSTGAAIVFGPGQYTFANGLNVGYGGITMGGGTLNVIGDLVTPYSASVAIGSDTVNVTGNVTVRPGTVFTGLGAFNIGGSLSDIEVNFAQSSMSVVGSFSVSSSGSFPNLASLAVGGDVVLGTYGTMSFRGGNYQISKGLSVGGSTTVSFGPGTYAGGRSSSVCGTGAPSICTTGSSRLVFAGPSTFLLANGATVGGGASLVMGSSGTGNSFQMGPNSDRVVIQNEGGSYLKLGDATAAGSVFEINGNIQVTGGGSCTFLSAASNHDVNGRIVTAGGTVLGAGVWTVNGAVGIGANAGGNVTCDGVWTGFVGNGVSLVMSNANPLTGSGPCFGQAFCVAAGYASVSLVAPTAGDHAKMAVIGPASGSAGAYFTEGGSGNTISGLLYFPLGSVRLDGAASVGNGTGQCLQVIAKDISLNGGSLLASTCVSGSASGSKVVLIR